MSSSAAAPRPLVDCVGASRVEEEEKKEELVVVVVEEEVEASVANLSL